ncbi:ABC transporter ATP-binding protein, partial [candidate division WOR-3 bacterium]|nr:ABC transporter ATP-binding protein [candidate division WOR-3 bacterium]
MKAIKVTDLKKKYRIVSSTESRYGTLRDSVAENFKKAEEILKRGRSIFKDKKSDFWALKGISFNVSVGERLGLIGANGAGKTTVLKILSRITNPTAGEAVLRGRVASLLEVGTGFHPELSGRENIFMNGSILGMKKEEIKRRFDQIVEFSGISEFIDTPVKRYSSGMYVRLAFSVAAHLESEILLIDEVLAVGDVKFQEKCLKKMKDITGESDRTIVFVTHNMAALNRFCERAMILNNGSLIFDGPVGKAIEKYLSFGDEVREKIEWSERERPGNGQIKIISIEVLNSDFLPSKSVPISQNFHVRIVYEVAIKKVKPQFSLVLSDKGGNCLFGSINNTDTEYYGVQLDEGRYSATCQIYGNLLNAGAY